MSTDQAVDEALETFKAAMAAVARADLLDELRGKLKLAPAPKRTRSAASRKKQAASMRAAWKRKKAGRGK